MASNHTSHKTLPVLATHKTESHLCRKKLCGMTLAPTMETAVATLSRCSRGTRPATTCVILIRRVNKAMDDSNHMDSGLQSCIAALSPSMLLAATPKPARCELLI